MLPLISLDDAKEYLNKSTVKDDFRLNQMIEVATLCAEEYADRALQARTTTATRSCDGGPAVMLRRPVRSVTSVTLSGVEQSPGSWCVDSAAGLLYRGAVPGAGRWPAGADNLVVVYEAGPENPSPIAVHAALEMLRHLWETQRGGPNREIRGDEWVSGMGYTFPNRVVQLLGPMRVPGIA